jgi:hypothetical protein
MNRFNRSLQNYHIYLKMDLNQFIMKKIIMEYIHHLKFWKIYN